jgi:hypothetical protein
MNHITAADLRDMIAEAITESIEIHRGSREVIEGEEYERPSGSPTDDEIDDFIASNALLDEETIEQIIDPGFLGFFAKRAQASNEWIKEFQEHLREWASTNAWLGADLPWRSHVQDSSPLETKIWAAGNEERPSWIETAPACLLIAIDLLNQGRLLSEMSWRDFEKLIAHLLESEGWEIELMRGTKDGGIDVISKRVDPVLGNLKALWQAKKYALKSKVRLSHVRELSAIRDRIQATKAVIVTTSHLTRGAIEWVRQDRYRLGSKEQAEMEHWVKGLVLGEDESQ